MDNDGKRITTEEALEKLRAHDQEFITLFEHGTLSVEVYKPNGVDRQQPHDRDEIYVVIAGSGIFLNDGVYRLISNLVLTKNKSIQQFPLWTLSRCRLHSSA